MTRYYDSDYVNTLTQQISSIRQEINPALYGINYYGAVSSDESVIAKNRADYAAASAKLKATVIKEKLQTLSNGITSFYGGVDGVSEEIYGSATNLSSVLHEALVTMTELESLLSHSTELGDLTPCSVATVFDKVEKARIKYAYEYAKELIRNNGSIDDASAEWLKDYLHGCGFKNFTQSDMQNFMVINDYLADKGHSDAWIAERFLMIIGSPWFDDIAVTGRYSGTDQAKCLKYLEEFLSTKDAESFRYNLLVNNLRGENGYLDQKVLESYRRFISKKGVTTLSEDYIKGYLQLVESFRKAGMSDELIYDSIASFYNDNNLSMIYHVGNYHGASQTAAINSIIDKFVKDGFNKQIDPNLECADDFLNVFYSNTTPGERMSILNYFNRLERGENIPVDEKLYFTMRFAQKFLGYEEVVDHTQKEFNQHTYFGALYKDADMNSKQGAGWCAMFVVWMIGKGGLLDGSIVTDVTPENAVPKHLWAGCPKYRELFRNAKRYDTAVNYTPCNGDLVLFREYYQNRINIYHIGIVLGVDVENKKVYTIEGNTGGPQGSESEEKHGIRIKSYDMDWERIGGYCKMGGEERNMRMIAGYEDQVVENYFVKDLYIDCREGFVMNDE